MFVATISSFGRAYLYGHDDICTCIVVYAIIGCAGFAQPCPVVLRCLFLRSGCVLARRSDRMYSSLQGVESPFGAWRVDMIVCSGRVRPVFCTLRGEKGVADLPLFDDAAIV